MRTRYRVFVRVTCTHMRSAVHVTTILRMYYNKPSLHLDLRSDEMAQCERLHSGRPTALPPFHMASILSTSSSTPVAKISAEAGLAFLGEQQAAVRSDPSSDCMPANWQWPTRCAGNFI